jgi:endonuclease/exonuclease/phosphatase family metal-dependent hydrolase
MKRLRIARKITKQAHRPIARLDASDPESRHPEPTEDSLSDSLPNAGVEVAVMSFNIRRGTRQDGRNHWVYRRSLVNIVLNRYRPGVLGLQEALDFQISEVSAMLPGYQCVGFGSADRDKELHNTIFYDASLFALSDQGTFWLSETPDIPGSRGWGNIIPRTCTWVRLIEKESQQAFYFYNTHLDHISQRARKKSVISLIHHIHGRPFQDPFVLVGDFNARGGSAPIRYLKGKISLPIGRRVRTLTPIPLMDTLRVRYPGNRNTATFHGFRRYLFRLRLDYIFIPPSVRVIDAEIIRAQWNRRYPSDHFPLLAYISLPADSATT